MVANKGDKGKWRSVRGDDVRCLARGKGSKGSRGEVVVSKIRRGEVVVSKGRRGEVVVSKGGRGGGGQ